MMALQNSLLDSNQSRVVLNDVNVKLSGFGSFPVFQVDELQNDTNYVLDDDDAVGMLSGVHCSEMSESCMI